MNERDLVLRAKRGDQDAFEQLVLDNQNRIYSLALRLMGDREEAADLAQEAFLKAWQGPAHLPGREQLFHLAVPPDQQRVHRRPAPEPAQAGGGRDGLAGRR